MTVSSSPTRITLAIGLLIGLLGTGYFIKSGLENFKGDSQGTVIVKGLVEYPVKADLAYWEIRVASEGGDLHEVLKNARASAQKLKAYLVERGFEKDMIELVPVQYTNNFQDNRTYVMRMGFSVKTNKVDDVERAYGSLGSLADQGVTFESAQGPEFRYIKFNEKRPEIFSMAVKNAQEMAAKFAQDAGVSLGKIAYADQGTFEILAADGREGYDARFAKEKVIRVVSRFTYKLH